MNFCLLKARCIMIFDALGEHRAPSPFSLLGVSVAFGDAGFLGTVNFPDCRLLRLRKRCSSRHIAAEMLFHYCRASPSFGGLRSPLPGGFQNAPGHGRQPMPASRLPLSAIFMNRFRRPFKKLAHDAFCYRLPPPRARLSGYGGSLRHAWASLRTSFTICQEVRLKSRSGACLLAVTALGLI